MLFLKVLLLWQQGRCLWNECLHVHGMLRVAMRLPSFADASLQTETEDDRPRQETQNPCHQQPPWPRHRRKPLSYCKCFLLLVRKVPIPLLQAQRSALPTITTKEGSSFVPSSEEGKRKILVIILLVASLARRSAMSWRGGLVARKAAWLQSGKSCVVCVGNSAGDVDSIVSAVAAAYLFQGVALVRFPREEFAMRRDAVALMKACGFVSSRDDGSVDELIYEKEVPKNMENVKVALTDHNVLDSSLVSADVVAIFDHHADEGEHLDAVPRDVDASAGSTCSLLGERLILEQKLQALLRNREKKPPPKELLALVAGAAILDTRGFDANKNKFSRRDVRVVNGLLDILEDKDFEKLPTPENNTKDEEDDLRVYEKSLNRLRTRKLPEPLCSVADKSLQTVVDLSDFLGEARHDVHDLTASQLLRMDYKRATVVDSNDTSFDIGVAGVLVALPTFSSKAENIASLLAALAEEKNLAVVFAMTAKHKKKKAILYYVADKTLPPTFNDALETALRALPTGLPEHLGQLPLFKSQNILDSGFLLEEFKDLAPQVRYSTFPHTITRKTMLPTLIHFASIAASHDNHPQETCS